MYRKKNEKTVTGGNLPLNYSSVIMSVSYFLRRFNNFIFLVFSISKPTNAFKIYVTLITRLFNAIAYLSCIFLNVKIPKEIFTLM